MESGKERLKERWQVRREGAREAVEEEGIAGRKESSWVRGGTGRGKERLEEWKVRKGGGERVWKRRRE